MELARLQEAFVDAVFEQPQQNHPAILDLIRESADPGRRQRMGIYRAAILSSFNRVLAEVYPVIARLLGDEFFEAMSHVYARQHASDRPDLNEYGKAMPEFIESFEPLQEMAFVADVARLEWSWHALFYAADESPCDFSKLAELSDGDQAQVIFRLPLGARLLHSDFPISRIWHQNQPEVANPAEIDLQDGEERLLVWRAGYARQIKTLDQQQWRLLQAVSNKRTFQELLEESEWYGDVSRMLPTCISRGWISAFELKQ